MFFDIFSKKRDLETERQEREIQKIRGETLRHAKTAADNTKKLIKLLDDETLGVTGSIFLATGGDKRIKE